MKYYENEKGTKTKMSYLRVFGIFIEKQFAIVRNKSSSTISSRLYYYLLHYVYSIFYANKKKYNERKLPNITITRKVDTHRDIYD